MRVFADSFFGGVRLATSDYPNGREIENGRIQVTVDGKVVRYASYADDEKGAVRALEIITEPGLFPKHTKEEFAIRLLKGKVRIHISSEGVWAGVPTYIRML